MAQLGDITIGFSTTNKWISRVIRWITRGKFSHAWIAFDDPSLDLRLVFQAEAWGVELRPWARWKKENIAKAEFALTEPDSASRILRDLVSKALGSKYDWWSAALVGVKAWLKRWVKGGFDLRPSRSPRRLMCAELVTDFLDRLRVFRSPAPDPETTSPSELFLLLRDGRANGVKILWQDKDVAK